MRLELKKTRATQLRRKVMKKVWIGIALALALTACGTQLPPNQQQSQGVVLRAHTKVLGKTPAAGVDTRIFSDATQNIADIIGASPDLSTISFDAGSAYAAGLQPGDVISAPPNQVASYGFLRQVTEVQDLGSEIRVYSQETDLDTAIEYADVDQSVELTQNNIASVTYADGTRLSGKQLQKLAQTRGSVTLGSVNIPFNSIKVCDGDNNTSINATGSLSASLKAFLDVRLYWYGAFREVSTGIEANENLNLSMNGQCKYNLFSVDYPIAKINFNTFTIWVGPVPVVITPYVNVNVGANGNITLSASYNINQNFNGRYGVRWNKGSGFSAINETNFSVTGLDSISASASLNLLGYVRGEAGFKFYGFAYLYAVAKPYIEWTGTYTLPANTFDYNMYAGMKVSVGGRLQVLGKSFGEYNSPEYDVGRRLISSSVPTPDPDPDPVPPCPGCALP
jgi:hypothetical protein